LPLLLCVEQSCSAVLHGDGTFPLCTGCTIMWVGLFSYTWAS
jgi:hypothetical protein